MTITGNSLLAGTPVHGSDGEVQAVNPATGEKLDPSFGLVSPEQLAEATTAAAAAFDTYRAISPEERATFLERIADNIEAVAAELTERAVAETGLPAARIEGERGRTTGQLRLFADVVRQGDHHRPASIPRSPSASRPRGWTSASGTSRWARSRSSVPATSRWPSPPLVGTPPPRWPRAAPSSSRPTTHIRGPRNWSGQAIARAVADSGLPGGVFSLVFGAGRSIGQALVADPRIKAVGFTGSQAGGVALMKTAAARPEPIPVYAEMSSINPVYVLPGAIATPEAAVSLAEAFVGSLTMGSGQFCTNPGLLFVPEGEAGDAFVSAAAAALSREAGQTMLTSGIAEACAAGIARLESAAGVQRVAEGVPGETLNAPSPVLFSTDWQNFTATHELQEEIFGAAGLFVRYPENAALLAASESLQGQLTATVQATAEDTATISDLLPVLERKVGRILFNGWPTGVEVNHAMVHGGPFPATSDPRTTSVGTLAIHRFLRPVSYQNAPDEVLPEPLQESNPWKLNRRIDGTVLNP